MSKQTRRDFLENSMLAAAAAVTGSVLPQTLSAAESTSPNERLRIAVLGVNGRGQSHLSGYMKRKNAEVVAIVDPDENVGQKKGVERVEKTTGKRPAFYQDLRRVMDDDSIDAVSIATPNHWHALAAIWAIQSGKDVYVEKPVSHNVSEGRRIVEAARKYNKICQAGTQSRSMPGAQQAIEYVQSGKMGNVKLARALCYKRRKSIGPLGNYDIPAGIDYNIWRGPAPMAPLTRRRFHYDWHWQFATGNGDLGNQGIHQMDVARWGLGVDNIGSSVVSYGGRFGYEDAGDTANTQLSIHDFGDKRLVFEVRGLETDALRGTKVGVIFYGQDSYITIASSGGGGLFDRDGKMIKKFPGGGDDHFGNFLAAVRSRKKEDLTGDILEGHLSSALCHLGNISYLLGKEVTPKDAKLHLGNDRLAVRSFGRVTDHLRDNGIDLETTKIRFGAKLAVNSDGENFSGPMSEQANQMLTREYRKPFVVPSAENV